MKKWRHQKLFEYIKDNFNKNIKVLELGPGDGTMLFNLYSSGYKNINFIDKEDNINYREIKSLDIGKTVNLNKESISFPDKSFDLIIALQILEHLENPWHFKRECVRLLKSGGKLIFSMPHGHNLASKIRFLLKGNIMRYERDNEHITFFTINIFNRLFLKEFELKRIDYSRPTLSNFGINRFLPNKPFLKKLFSKNIYYFLKKV